MRSRSLKKKTMEAETGVTQPCWTYSLLHRVKEVKKQVSHINTYVWNLEEWY